MSKKKISRIKKIIYDKEEEEKKNRRNNIVLNGVKIERDVDEMRECLKEWVEKFLKKKLNLGYNLLLEFF